LERQLADGLYFVTFGTFGTFGLISSMRPKDLGCVLCLLSDHEPRAAGAVGLLRAG
jgi:hypothetical protein